MVRLRSFTLRFAEGRARVVPAVDANGCAFQGPGVDVLGAEAVEALRLALPLVRALEACEPGAQVRSIAVDLAEARLLATIEGPERPRAIRMARDQGGERMLDAAGPLLEYLTTAVERALAARSEKGTS